MSHRPHDPHSTSRLTSGAARHFPGETLFARVARTVCEAECLPRKELYETWEVARRVIRRFRGGRVIDLAAGHGLLAHVMCLLDPTLEGAIAADRQRPSSAGRLEAALIHRWPQLEGRVAYAECDLRDVAVRPTDAVLSVHACGKLTDLVLDVALNAQARVAVMPCCHSKRHCDTGGLLGWMDVGLAVDTTRAARLAAAGYRVHTAKIPEDITPKARLLFGHPPH
ncbi:MAG: methyltransferase [Myxococcota bacterium]